MTNEQLEQIVWGVAIVTVATVAITYVVVNDVTGVGVADDVLIAPLISFLGEGTIMIFQAV